MQHPFGRIVILNGAPRSGKSSIADAVRRTVPGTWMKLGVDGHSGSVIPPELRPGIGLRPGGERPDLEPVVERLYRALYGAIAAHAREGFDCIVDLGHHDDYAAIKGLLPRCARLLEDFSVLFVGVSALLDTILARRAESDAEYLKAGTGEIPAPILRWQSAVHAHDIYDLTLDTGTLTPEDCARKIADTLAAPPDGPTAFERLARLA